MRNLKKFLALVLAMVMAFSLMLSASAVDFEDYPDADQITDEFEEAVRVLTGLEVMQGDENGFRPGDYITRAEAAAIIYRAATGDVKDDQTGLYADYGTFTDVKHDDWFAGYVGFCQNAGYIKGTTPTTFNPYGNVTGWEVLAMILRAVGYGKNNEFTGSAWQVNVASLAEELHITDNVKVANFANVLGNSARRDVVADLVFQTMAFVPTVTYSPALGYNPNTTITNDTKNPSLGVKIFGLRYTEWKQNVGDWGEPGYYWYADKSANPVFAASKIVATILPEPTKVYVDTVRECDVSEDLGIKTEAKFNLCVNQNWLTDPDDRDLYRIVATDTVTKVGGQGRETKIWYKTTRSFDNAVMPNTVVMIDTYLAKVVNVKDAVLDPAGHVITEARLTVDMYDKTQGTNSTTPNPSRVAIDMPTGSKDNWEYAVGDMILVNAATDPSHGRDINVAGTPSYAANAAMTNTSGLNHLYNQQEAEEAAFETNVTWSTLEQDDTANVIGKADYVLGKQTVTYWNQGKHTVDGTDLQDQLTLFLDVAGTTTGTTFAWYKDTRGNLIGIGEAPNTTTYGVITSIYSALNQGDTNTDGTAKAIANVLYADGTTGTVTIDRFLASVSGNLASNGHGAAGHLRTATDGTAELIPIYDYNAGASTMQAIDSTNPSDAQYKGLLSVAPVASVNAMNENRNNTVGGKYFGIINCNLFKFVSSNDGSVTAIEVAGYESTYLDYGDFTTTGTQVTGTTAQENTGMYAGLYNASADAGVNGGSTTKLSKSLGYLNVYSLFTTAPSTYSVHRYTVRLDDNTKIMVRTPDTTTINVYDGLKDLPGDVVIGDGQEVDWADYDGDGRADVIYVRGSIDGIVTYGLFYYNGGGAQWNGTDKTGTINGYLNGEATTLTFSDQSEYNLIINNIPNYDVAANVGYAGRIYAVQMTNGVVSNLMGSDNVNISSNAAITGTNLEQIARANVAQRIERVVLRDKDVAIKTTTGIEQLVTGQNASGTAVNRFQTGSSNGNPYERGQTKITYFRDSNNSSGALADVTYNDGSRLGVSDSIEITSTSGYSNTKGTYLLTGATKRIGELEMLNKAGACDVTIVYDDASKTILEIYVATDPNVTPNPQPTGDNMQILQASYNNTNGLLSFIVTIEDNVTWTTGDTVTLTMTDNQNGKIVVNGVVTAYDTTAGNAGHISSSLTNGSLYQYTVVVSASGLSMMDNTNRYSGKLTLTDSSASTDYIANFTSLSIF